MRSYFQIERRVIETALALVALFLISAIPAYAQYVPLVGLPAVEGSGTGLAGYFNQLYMVTIAAGAILAFLKISIAGVKWSMSDIVTDKSDAKHDINGALLGLAILLVPFIVLNTIYPGLASLNILENSADIRVRTTAPTPDPGTNVTPIEVTPETPTGPPPQFDQVDWPFSCVSQTDCVAARGLCNAIRGSVQSIGQNPQCGYSVMCRFRRNTNTEEGSENPTPCR